MSEAKPGVRPVIPHFSSGPCAKRPGWSLQALTDAALGRSHRSKIGKAKLKRAIDLSREVLQAPADYRIGIVPASDTGAVEMALWSLLGPRPVTMLAWESFGEGWVSDVQKELKLKDVKVLKAPYGELPDLAKVDFATDVVFAWNGTTSGVRVPNADWIKADREGLTICDATSAAFAQKLDWSKLDVVTWSWQKVLGGEAAHGMIALSPRAVARLESHTPAWPLPKIFRMTKGGKLIEGIFKGETINTPSMLCVEDYIVALEWAKSIGGLPALIARSEANAKAVADFNLQKEDFLAVIDGMDMDAAEDIRAPNWTKLDLYCDRVASAVGRLSVRVFGMRENDGLALAHHLGRALQLTNILRDIDEDADIGRLYLPSEELQKAGITSTDPKTVLESPSLWQPCEAVAARALEHFKEADRIMARNPRKVVKAPKIMEEVYRVMLNGMTSRGWSPPRTRVSISPLRLSWIAVQYAII